MARIEWDDLPLAVRDGVLSETGPVTEVRSVADGLTCWVAAMLVTESGRRWFVKGCPESDDRAFRSLRHERVVFPMLTEVGPDFGWCVRAADWELMAYDWVDGRHADLGPGSPDLTLVAEVLLKAQEITVPHYVPIPTIAQVLRPHLDAAEAALLGGDTLVHRDTNPHNLLIGAERAWMVDWAMAAKGPAWVDAAYTTVRLMEADTPPAEALEWAAGFPSWRGADPAAVAAFVAGTSRQWEAMVGLVDCVPNNRRFVALLDSCR